MRRCTPRGEVAALPTRGAFVLVERRLRRLPTVRVWPLPLLLLVTACASAPPTQLRTGASALSPGWRPFDMRGATVAMHHIEGGAMSASVSCDKSDEGASLDVLTNHLLFELEARKERSRTPLVIDGRAALRTRMSAAVDGVPVELELVVLKKDGCVVDAELVTPPGRLDARQADFARFYEGLALVRSGA